MKTPFRNNQTLTDTYNTHIHTQTTPAHYP